MRIVESLKNRLARLLAAPGHELGSWARLCQHQVQLWSFCAKRLRANNAMAMSSALSFRTIFALVPVLVLAFLTMKSLGMVEDKKRVLRDFLDRSGLAHIRYGQPQHSQPASAQADQAGADQQVTVAEKVESLALRLEAQLTVGRLGPIGIVLLIWTAVTLLTTMERSLNRIFEAPRSRPLGRRIMLYWSAVTLGPLLLIAAGHVGSLAMAAARDWPLFGLVIATAGRAGPIIVGILLLAILYTLMPNTTVRFRTSLEAALVAGPVWLVARLAFALYVQHVGKHSIYGAMGLVPLFLMWLNLSWYVFLFGAELAHTAANLGRMRAAELHEQYAPGPWDLLAAVVALAKAGAAGAGPVPLRQLSAELDLSEQLTESLLGRLSAGGIVCPVAGRQEAAYVLARPAGRLAVCEVLGTGSGLAGGQPSRNLAAEIAQAVELAKSRAEAGIKGMTVDQIISTPKT